MIPSKYNFYIGIIKRLYFRNNVGINDSGEFVRGESGKYSYGLSLLSEGNKFFINLISINNYNAIFFYDSSQNLISSKPLIEANNAVIEAPVDAKYWAIRFTNEDSNFEIKRNTDFVCVMNSVNPHYKELNKKYSKESGQEFFRISLDGKISLFGSDYELVHQSSLEDRMIFMITKYNRISSKWVEYYKGEFNKTNCKFDYEKKSCELKTSALDEYNDILNNYENTYDLIKLAPATSKINMHKRSLMQVYIRGANSISNFFGGIYWEDDVNEAIDSHNDLVKKYYFSYIKAGNEFYVENAGISEVNGVYAGTSGNWDNWNGYTCYAGSFINNINNMAYIYIKRNSDNKVLYKSISPYNFADRSNLYINSDNVEMANVNNANDRFTIKSPFVYHIYRRLLCDVDTIEDSEGVKNTYDLPSDDFVTDNRNYKKCIGFTGGLFFCTSRAVDKPTRYGQNDYGQYFTNEFIPTSSGLDRPLPISRNSWANASLWYVYDSYYSIYEKMLRKPYVLKDSYSIAEVIKALLKEVDPAIKHEATAEYSRFLYDPNVPISMGRFYVYITQKTNILKGEYDQPAQKAKISFEDVMKMLRDCFRCYWYIEDDKLKIEHISFFMRGGSYSGDENIQLDFTELADQFNKKSPSYFQSEIEYDKSDLNHRYEFGWMDDATDLFDGLTIDVLSEYVQKDKTEEITVSQFSSDVDYMLFNPSNFSDDGFTLLCPIENGSSLELPIIRASLIDEDGNDYEAMIQNYCASWLYLQRFYMYDMPADMLSCNMLEDLELEGIKMCMKHTIEFPTEEDLDKFKLIKTSIGNGKVDEISVNIDTRHTKVKLLYEPQ